MFFETLPLAKGIHCSKYGFLVNLVCRKQWSVVNNYTSMCSMGNQSMITRHFGIMYRWILSEKLAFTDCEVHLGTIFQLLCDTSAIFENHLQYVRICDIHHMECKQCN